MRVSEEEKEEDIQSLFRPSNKVSIYDLSNLGDEDNLRKLVVTAEAMRRANTPKPITAMRLGTPSGFQRIGTGTSLKLNQAYRPPTGFRPGTGFRPTTGADAVNRPMTAVRGAGYTSQSKMFDPMNQAAATSPPLELPKDETPKDKVQNQERKIMELIEEACTANCQGNYRKSLEKAKEASNKERNLIRFQEQAGLGDSHNMDLTYSVLFTLANQYASNELYTEALNTYQMIIKNRMFPNAHRLKVNMGNIYYKQGQYHKAIKMYRMALDQVPSSQKNLRIKIMHNIGMVFVRMGQWQEAASSLEYIMNEQGGHQAGLHLILCCMILNDKERMKSAFSLLLGVSLELEDEEIYNQKQDDAESAMIATAIRNDDLHTYEKQKQANAEHCILTAAKIIGPVIENTFSEGYDWCVATLKNSEYARLAADLEINKAIMYLKQGSINDAIDTLKTLNNESSVIPGAAVNLSFIYYLKQDYETAQKYGETTRNMDGYNASGSVNMGACAMARNQLEEAKSYFINALELDPACVEATYNLGLVLKRQGNYLDALECFQKFTGSLALLPDVVYQTASLFERLGDVEAASESYQQLIGLLPSDSNVLQKMGELCDHEGDKQQAYHYYSDSFRYNPGDLLTVNWLGSYYIEMQVIEKALVFFEKAILMQPNQAKWHMLAAGCHRRTGNLHRALTMYQSIHQQFPEDEECLRFLIQLCSELGMRETQDYIAELKKMEKTKEVRDRVSSSRPGSRRSNSGLSSRGGSGFSTVYENGFVDSGSRNIHTRRAVQMNHSAGSTDSGFAQSYIDAGYSDPLGPLPERPRTGMGKPVDYDDFGDEALGDDLLPE